MLFLVYMPFCVDSSFAILHLGDLGATASSHWSLGHGFCAGWWRDGGGVAEGGEVAEATRDFRTHIVDYVVAFPVKMEIQYEFLLTFPVFSIGANNV
jgi:hypothetical protein